MSEVQPSQTGEVVPFPLHEIAVNDVLVLRELTENDADEFYALVERNKQHLAPFMPLTVAKYRSPRRIRDRIRRERPPEAYKFGLWTENALVGYVKLTQQNNVTVRVGYFLDDAHTGKGYMTEALNAAKRYSLDRLGYREVVAELDRRNLKSWYVLERCGFKPLGSREPTASGEPFLLTCSYSEEDSLV